MYDMYPGSAGESRQNGIVYRGLAELFRRHRPEPGSTPDINSTLGQDMATRFDAMGAKGVDRMRLAAVSGIVQIDHGRRAEAAEVAELEEPAELMQEAPGA
jgi:hypothetical protein